MTGALGANDYSGIGYGLVKHGRNPFSKTVVGDTEENVQKCGPCSERQQVGLRTDDLFGNLAASTTLFELFG